MTLSACKYKDELPLKTINKIRSILADLDILTVESSWKNSIDGFYSVTVNIRNTQISTNGKGTTYEYALASAYAELMERLQNQAFFRLNFDLSKEALEFQGFYYAPDEKQISMEDFINSGEDWSKIQLDNVPQNMDGKELLKKWMQVSYEETPADFIALPYFDMTTSRISHIPIKMVSKMYMSNGMCAGNTPEEALVQGLSEVLERYVNMRIVLDKMAPPDIPLEYLKQYPKIFAMIEEIERSGNFTVILKDCSLGKGLPVVGVIFINKDDQSYFVKFGAHPIFAIAAERTLTELLQGQDIRNMMGVKEFSYKIPVEEEHENLLGILVNGSGYYHAGFFRGTASYEFTEFIDLKTYNNKQLLDYLVQLVQKLGYHVFVRDNSILEFPSFHIIVPGMSEIEHFYDVKEIEEYVQYNKLKRYIRNLAALSAKEIDEVIDFFGKMQNGSAPVENWLNIAIKAPVPWYYANNVLFVGALYYRQGDFANAYYTFDKFLHRAKYMPEMFDRGLLCFYKCVRDYLGTRADSIAEKEAIDLLSTMYQPDMIQGVINEFGGAGQFFDTFGYLSCWQCDQCKYSQRCSYMSHEKVYKALKERYTANPISQTTLTKLTVS
ncbi:hypothetical protein SRRS_10150 [Sporomusa rhizae]|uniref:YcaO-like family protein n=1 Tax=Sporomusa rhizae TaxID=357999 RepID=UPI00352BD0E9